MMLRSTLTLEAGDEDAARPHARRPGGRPLVLLAEDEEIVRAMVRTVLEMDGFEVLDADTGARAVAAAAGRLDTVAVLLTDVQMPGMSGPELAGRLRAARPDLPVVFMSAFAGTAARDAAAVPHAAFVPKPFRLDALRDAVRRAVAV